MQRKRKFKYGMDLSVELEGHLRVLDTNHRVIELVWA